MLKIDNRCHKNGKTDVSKRTQQSGARRTTRPQPADKPGWTNPCSRGSPILFLQVTHLLSASQQIPFRAFTPGRAEGRLSCGRLAVWYSAQRRYCQMLLCTSEHTLTSLGSDPTTNTCLGNVPALIYASSIPCSL